MIRFRGKFKVYDSPLVKVPTNTRNCESFWCSFNTKKQLIACNIIYLGKDKIMQQHKWYDGIIELLYGELFPPYAVKLKKDLRESINLNELYPLNAGGEIVGECELLEVIEIIRDHSKIKADENGFVRNGINIVMKE